MTEGTDTAVNPKEPKVTLAWSHDDKKLVVEAHHPALDEARDAVTKAHGAASNALKSANAKALDDYLVTLKDAQGDAVKKAAAEEKLRKAMEKHTPTEFEALKNAEKTVATHEKDLHTAKVAALEAAAKDPTKVVGHTEEVAEEIKKAAGTHLTEAKEAVKKAEQAVEAAEKAGKTKIGFANLSHNIGGKAWKRSKGVAFGNTVVTLLGAGLTWDAVVHANRKDENGERTVHRSGLVRTGEGIVGVAAVVASALRGGHSRAL